MRYVAVPKSYDPARPSPLILFLHGYGSSGAAHAPMFDLGSIPEDERVILLAPDGQIDKREMRYWNAVPACCDFEGEKPDDVGYLRSLIEQAKQRFSIDPRRVYVVGHSNGAAMAMRLLCDAADVFAAAVELAGPFYADIAGACHPSAPVSVRIMHGTADRVVPFEGGAIPGAVHPNASRFPIPSARGRAEGFAAINGCSAAQPGPDLDVDPTSPGAETKTWRWSECKGGADVELWAMHGVGHIPREILSWRSAWEFLAAHPKHP